MHAETKRDLDRAEEEKDEALRADKKRVADLKAELAALDARVEKLLTSPTGREVTKVLVKHAGRNSLIPVFSLLGLQVGGILGGTVILESIFSIPGMGSLIFEAVQMRDYPVVLGCVIVYGGIFILVNLLVDVLYAAIDTRIR